MTIPLEYMLNYAAIILVFPSVPKRKGKTSESPSGDEL